MITLRIYAHLQQNAQYIGIDDTYVYHNISVLARPHERRELTAHRIISAVLRAREMRKNYYEHYDQTKVKVLLLVHVNAEHLASLPVPTLRFLQLRGETVGQAISLLQIQTLDKGVLKKRSQCRPI